MKINTQTTTNRLLLLIVMPILLFVLKTLNFILIPLFGALLVALIFMPLLRWFSKKNLSKTLAISVVISIVVLLALAVFSIIRISAKEILSAKPDFWETIMHNINNVLVPIIDFMGIEDIEEQNNVSALLHSDALISFISSKVGWVLQAIRQTVVMLLMAVFFFILLIAGSVNVQKMMEEAIFKKRIPAIKTFITLEKGIVKFIVVKFLISIATGIAFSIACYAYSIPFPIFWGTMAFLINFIQMVGSIVITAALTLFGLAILSPGLAAFSFIIVIIGIQVVFGSILEPIFMGKTFSINTITILIMIMLWGYIWGVPGLIFSIPITVALKTIFEQFEKTKIVSKIMS